LLRLTGGGRRDEQRVAFWSYVGSFGDDFFSDDE
jgi:hypothetical protein